MSQALRTPVQQSFSNTVHMIRPTQDWILRHNDSVRQIKNDDQPLDFSFRSTCRTEQDVMKLSMSNGNGSLPSSASATNGHEGASTSRYRSAVGSSSPRSTCSSEIDIDDIEEHDSRHRIKSEPLAESSGPGKAQSPVYYSDQESEMESSHPPVPSLNKPSAFKNGMLPNTNMMPAQGFYNSSAFPGNGELLKYGSGILRNGLMNGNGILRTALQPPVVPVVSLPVDTDAKNPKHTRPFKAYNPQPNPIVPGLPILPLGVMQDFEDQEYRYQQYIQQYYAKKSSDSKKMSVMSEERPVDNDRPRLNQPACGRPDSSASPNQVFSDLEVSGDSTGSPNNARLSVNKQVPDISSSQTNNNGKRVRALPEELKDNAYWERRKKNNEAAKRSRDSRRQKEDYIAMRAKFLEDENKSLRLTIAFLRQELNAIKCCAAHNHSRL